MLMLLKCLTILNLLLFFLSLCPVSSYAGWQDTLNSYFDYADTFDEIADWSMTSTDDGDYIVEDNPSHFTTFTNRTDGGIKWDYYNQGAGGATPEGPTIDDHGTDFRWTSGAANSSDSGNHKSLCIQYPQGHDEPDYGETVTGAQRFGVKTGTSDPTDGYSEVHMFFMMKIPYGFINNDSSSTVPDFDYHNFVKIVSINAGFRDTYHWGTVAEYNYCEGQGASQQYLNEYGSDGGTWNVRTGASYSDDEVWTIDFDYSSSRCTYNNTPQIAKLGDTSSPEGFGVEIGRINRQWVGVEIRQKQGNASTGSVEVWVYNESGTVTHHWEEDPVQTLGYYSTYRFNKFEFGGNRWDGGYTTHYTGTHTAGDSSTVLTDSGLPNGSTSFAYIWNVTDMSYCLVSSITSTTVTCDGLRSGTDNTWQSGDQYKLVADDSFGPVTKIYIDDVIIDADRIGPTYFTLLEGSGSKTMDGIVPLGITTNTN